MRLIGTLSVQENEILNLAKSPRGIVRQSVLTGPVDANGRADFLQAGTGLQVITKALSPSLLLSFGDGLGTSGAVESIIEVSSSLSWGGLPANTTSYLYLDLVGTAVIPGHTTVNPVYSQTRPATPTNLRYWYPTDHRRRGEVWNGVSWNPVLRLFVGQAITNASTPTEIRSYAYQGRWESETALVYNGLVILSHNLGCRSLVDWRIRPVVGFTPYSSFEDIRVGESYFYTDPASRIRNVTPSTTDTLLLLRCGESLIFTNGTGSWVNPLVTDFTVFCRVWRPF